MMTSTRPSIDLRVNYRTTQACALLGIHRNTLARYAARYKVITKIDDMGYTLYPGKELMRLYSIKQGDKVTPRR